VKNLPMVEDMKTLPMPRQIGILFSIGGNMAAAISA
jgi:hypothetical protein